MDTKKLFRKEHKECAEKSSGEYRGNSALPRRKLFAAIFA
jgi:hypothetical protein